MYVYVYVYACATNCVLIDGNYNYSNMSYINIALYIHASLGLSISGNPAQQFRLNASQITYSVMLSVHVETIKSYNSMCLG